MRVGMIVGDGATPVAAAFAQTPEQLARLQRITVKLAGTNYFKGGSVGAQAKLLENYKDAARQRYPWRTSALLDKKAWNSVEASGKNT